MSLQAFQRDARSLIKNGNFGQGTSGWEGPNLTHIDLGGEYGLGIGALPEALPPGSASGAWQWLDRANTVGYGSTRRIDNITITPLGPRTAFLKVYKGTTLLDGVLVDDVVQDPVSLDLEDYTADLLFQHPFQVFDLIPGPPKTLKSFSPAAGSSVPVTDYTDPSSSTEFRAVRTVRPTTYMPGDLASTPDLTKYYSLALEVASSEDVYAPVLDQTGIDAGLASIVGGALVLSDYTEDLSNHVLVVPGGYAQIVGGSGTYTLAPLSPGIPTVDGLAYPFPDDADLPVWAVYRIRDGACARTLALFRYTLSVAYSYDAAYALPAPPVIEFTAAGDTVAGTGQVLTTMPRKDAAIRTVDEEGTWKRSVVSFDLETSEPRLGRPRLRFDVAGNTPFSNVSIGGNSTDYPPGTPEYPAYNVQFFVPDSAGFDETPLLTAPYLSFTLLDVNTGAPLPQLIQFPTYPLTPLAPATIGPTVLHKGVSGKFITVIVPGTIGFFGSPPLVPYDSLELMFVSQAVSQTRIRRVFLTDNQLTTVFDVSDGYTAPDPLPLNELVAFDALISQVDYDEAAVPKGVVVLYAGPGCPAGFRRVNAVGAAEEIAVIPAPDTVTYVASTDETTLLWDALSLPVADTDGQVQVIDALTQTIEVSGSPTLIVDVTVPQQQVQPGMALRVPSGTESIGARAAAEPLDPSFLVLDVRPGVSSTAPSGGSSSAIISGGHSQGVLAYPATVPTSLIEPPFRDDPPFAPPVSEQSESWPIGSFVATGETNSILVIEAQELVGLELTLYSVAGAQYEDSISSSLPPFAVGDVVWCDWTTTMTEAEALALDADLVPSTSIKAGRFVSGFVGIVHSLATNVGPSSADVLEIRRYDGKPLYTPGGTITPSQLVAPDGLSGHTTSTLEISPVKLYGTAQSGSGASLVVSGVKTTKTVGSGQDYWVISDADSVGGGSLTIRVAGQFPSNASSVILEPGGYLQYDDYGVKYGAGGHSHEVAKAATGSETVPAWPLADDVLKELPSQHTHGLLKQYTYNMPAYTMFTPCEKI